MYSVTPAIIVFALVLLALAYLTRSRKESFSTTYHCIGAYNDITSGTNVEQGCKWASNSCSRKKRCRNSLNDDKFNEIKSTCLNQGYWNRSMCTNAEPKHCIDARAIYDHGDNRSGACDWLSRDCDRRTKCKKKWGSPQYNTIKDGCKEINAWRAKKCGGGRGGGGGGGGGYHGPVDHTPI